MDGPSGGGSDNRGDDGVWQGRKYDATHQIKQLLGVPTEDDEKQVVECSVRSPPQNIPQRRQIQDQPMNNHHLDRSGSPSTRQQRWDSHRYHDGNHRGDCYGSPSRNHPRLYDQNRTPPHRYHEIRPRHDSYGSPGNHRVGSYDRGYSNSPRNHHHIRDMSKDHKELRANGPRHMNTSMVGHSGGAPDTEAPDYPPSPEVLAELEEQFLYPLKKKSLKFPKAKYFCRLCDYHCDSLAVCRKHIMDNRHRKLKETKDIDTSLKNMPLPSEAQIAAIEKLVQSVAEDMKVSPDMMQKRREVVTQLNKLLISKVEGCHLEMVGSSLSGFCLKNSNINVDVVMDDNLNPSTALLAVKELVGRSTLYKSVVDDLSSSFPTMAFTHVKTGLRVVVGACNTSSSKLTNQLLADYASLDPRVLVLGIAFRYWAQLCQIDNQGRGTLPPHVFPLMVVHFLQQHNPPVLPVLHLLHPKPDGESYLKPADLGDSWKAGKNTQGIGRLWLEMFRFYAVGFKITEYVINVRQKRPMTRAEKNWSKKIAVEDPFLQKRNLTRTVSGNLVFEYIVDRFKTTYRYFAIPQLAFGPLFQHIAVKEVAQSQSEGSSECEMEKTDDDVDVTVEGEEFEDDEDRGSLSGCEQDLSTLAIEDTTTDDAPVTPSTNGIDVKEEELDLSIDKITTSLTLVTPSQAAKLMQQVQDNHIDFKFMGKVFNDGVDPPLICGSCQKEGHCKADCREDELPPLKPLPPMKPSFINQLSTIFEKLTRDFEPRQEEIEERDRIVADLQFYIRQFFQGVTLKLFGSSANGFGFQHSDLDICLTFEGNPTGEDIDHIKVIESLAEKLKKYRQCGHVIAITTAKVPIVKFSIRRASLEGDLSLYNTLALQNTKLLATYAKIDHRVKCLGYGMKYFAKLCDIGDASRGSLSSYAYILMVLHFLQQCKPPVIPVLQELYDHSKPAPELIIDGRNAWFFDDLDSLPKVWKDYNKNKESVGELWVSMLRYYTETFNWKEHVVTIRQHAPLTRLQKLWNSRCIVIEDPFDLSHNLGAGLSRKMNTFIMKAFIRGREIFGSPISFPQGYRSLVDYLFDTKQLTDGAPPNDRGCRCCGKIGHIIKDCPKKKLNMERREKKERHKERHEQQRVHSETKKEEREELKKVNLAKLDQKQMQDGRPSDNIRRKDGSGGNTHATSLDAEDVASGKSPAPTSTSKLAHSVKDHSRMADQPPQGKASFKASPSTSSSTTPSSVMADSVVNAKLSGHNNCKSLLNKPSNTNSSVAPSRGVSSNDKNNGSCGSGAVVANGPTINDIGIRESSRGVASAVNVSGISVIADGCSGEKLALAHTSEGGIVPGLGVPPGFHLLGHANQSYPNQGLPVKDHNPSQGIGANQISSADSSSNQSIPANNKVPKSVGHSGSIVHGNVYSQAGGSQQYPLLLEKQQQVTSQQKQQLKYSENWSGEVIPQQYLATKSQEQLKKDPTPVIVSSAQNHQSQQQQQIFFSITPAALFHMASQAAGGQLSAVLMPNVSESSSTRTNSSIPTSSSLGTTNSNVNAPPPPPPPGFSAPVAINYPNQQIDAMPYNKLVIGSPLYRSPASQAEGQPVVPSTASQSFITPIGQSVGGMAGVYALQQSSGGSQFTNMTPTGTPHSPHALADPSLSQQQVPYDTRHFISQVPQGLHQGVPQGVPQSLTSVPPGIPQAVTQAVPQGLQGGPPAPPPGLSTSVPQGVQGMSQGLHQNLAGGVPQVSLGSALSPAIQPVPIGHHLPQHYPQPSFPQQGYQMAVPGPNAYYQELVYGDPSLQNPSPNAQGPPTLPAEMLADMAFQRPDVYDSQMSALPQYLASGLPQHQNIISQMSQPHPNMSLAPQHGPPTAAGPGPAYTPANVIFIEGERDGSQILQ